jgi:hypothetical protein
MEEAVAMAVGAVTEVAAVITAAAAMEEAAAMDTAEVTAVASAIASADPDGDGREEIGFGAIGRRRSSSTIALPATITTSSASASCAHRVIPSTSGDGVYRTFEELEP